MVANAVERLWTWQFGEKLIADQKRHQQDSRFLRVLQNLRLTNAGIPKLFPSYSWPKRFLVAPVRFLDLLDRLDELLSAEELQYLRRGNARLILDLSGEAAEFTGYSEEKLLSLHRALVATGLKPSSVFLINANIVSSRALPVWAARHRLPSSINALGYSFYLCEYLSELFISKWFSENYPRYVAERTQSPTNDSKKLFICLNLRPRPHRLAIVLHLLRTGLLERSIVSFFGEEFGHRDTRSVATQEEALTFVRSLPSGEALLAAFPRLQSMLPMTFDRTNSQMRKDLWERNAGEISFLFPERAPDGTPICTAHIEIVTETWFTDNSCLYLTEKTLRPLIRLQPFIIIGCPGTLAYLQSFGFQTFAPFIDETYDLIINPAQRFAAICREIDRLAVLGPGELEELQRVLLPRLQHNANLLLNEGTTLAEREIRENIGHGLRWGQGLRQRRATISKKLSPTG